MKEKGPCPATGNYRKQFLKGDAACLFCRRRRRDMTPPDEERTPKPPPPPPPDVDGDGDVAEDAFGNDGLGLWWVPTEFTHELADGSLARGTFLHKVAGGDAGAGRGNAGAVGMDDIVGDNPEFDGFDADDVVATLETFDSVCGAEHEPWDGEEIVLRVNEEADVGECLD